MDFQKFVNKVILDAPEYSMAHFARAFAKGEKLNRSMGNEMQYPPAQCIQDAIIQNLQFANLYPEDVSGAEVLREKCARYCGVEKDNISIGDGSTEVIDFLFRIFLEPGDEIIGSEPDYPSYRTRSFLTGAKYMGVRLNSDLTVNVDGLLNAITDKTKLIILSRPHNPAGSMVSTAEVEKLIKSNIPVIVDEAYIEFADHDKSVAPLVLIHPNLIVLRTFSKAFGLAGLRFGFGVLDQQLFKYANRVRIPINVNMLAQVAAEAALDNLPDTLQNTICVKQTRQWMFKELGSIKGLKPFPSQANFILINTKETGISSHEIVEKLLEKNIFVRDFSKLAGQPMNEFFRITIGTPENMQQIMDELRKIIPSN